jgi:hypothetical protein
MDWVIIPGEASEQSELLLIDHAWPTGERLSNG